MGSGDVRMISRILFVAGGTGGHIIPAVSLGNWINEKEQGTEVRFICGNRDVEQDIYSSLGIEPFVLEIEGSPLGKKDPGCVLRRSMDMVPAFVRAYSLFKTWRPDLCVLFGGYISLVPMLMSQMFNVPVIFHEQNSFAGRMTRHGSRKGKPVISGWKECTPLEKGKFRPLGIPVRKLKRLQDHEAWNILHIGSPYPEGPIIVVIGGSLGSRDLISYVKYLAEREYFGSWSFLVLAEEDDSLYPFPGNMRFVGKRWDMAPIYTLADGAITRAGASTLAELGVYGVPCVIIPWMGSSESHQLLNAEAFLKDFEGELWIESINTLDSLEKKVRNLMRRKRCSVDTYELIDQQQDLVCKAIWEEMLVHAGRESL